MGLGSWSETSVYCWWNRKLCLQNSSNNLGSILQVPCCFFAEFNPQVLASWSMENKYVISIGLHVYSMSWKPKPVALGKKGEKQFCSWWEKIIINFKYTFECLYAGQYGKHGAVWHCSSLQTYRPRGMLRNTKITILGSQAGWERVLRNWFSIGIRSFLIR